MILGPRYPAAETAWRNFLLYVYIPSMGGVTVDQLLRSYLVLGTPDKRGLHSASSLKNAVGETSTLSAQKCRLASPMNLEYHFC